MGRFDVDVSGVLHANNQLLQARIAEENRKQQEKQRKAERRARARERQAGILSTVGSLLGGAVAGPAGAAAGSVIGRAATGAQLDPNHVMQAGFAVAQQMQQKEADAKRIEGLKRYMRVPGVLNRVNRHESTTPTMAMPHPLMPGQTHFQKGKTSNELKDYLENYFIEQPGVGINEINALLDSFEQKQARFLPVPPGVDGHIMEDAKGGIHFFPKTKREPYETAWTPIKNPDGTHTGYANVQMSDGTVVVKPEEAHLFQMRKEQGEKAELQHQQKQASQMILRHTGDARRAAAALWNDNPGQFMMDAIKSYEPKNNDKVQQSIKDLFYGMSLPDKYLNAIARNYDFKDAVALAETYKKGDKATATSTDLINAKKLTLDYWETEFPPDAKGKRQNWLRAQVNDPEETLAQFNNRMRTEADAAIGKEAERQRDEGFVKLYEPAIEIGVPRLELEALSLLKSPEKEQKVLARIEKAYADLDAKTKLEKRGNLNRMKMSLSGVPDNVVDYFTANEADNEDVEWVVQLHNDLKDEKKADLANRKLKDFYVNMGIYRPFVYKNGKMLKPFRDALQNDAFSAVALEGALKTMLEHSGETADEVIVDVDTYHREAYKERLTPLYANLGLGALEEDAIPSSPFKGQKKTKSFTEQEKAIKLAQDHSHEIAMRKGTDLILEEAHKIEKSLGSPGGKSLADLQHLDSSAKAFYGGDAQRLQSWNDTYTKILARTVGAESKAAEQLNNKILGMIASATPEQLRTLRSRVLKEIETSNASIEVKNLMMASHMDTIGAITTEDLNERQFGLSLNEYHARREEFKKNYFQKVTDSKAKNRHYRVLERHMQLSYDLNRDELVRMEKKDAADMGIKVEELQFLKKKWEEQMDWNREKHSDDMDHKDADREIAEGHLALAVENMEYRELEIKDLIAHRGFQRGLQSAQLSIGIQQLEENKLMNAHLRAHRDRTFGLDERTYALAVKRTMQDHNLALDQFELLREFKKKGYGLDQAREQRLKEEFAARMDWDMVKTEKAWKQFDDQFGWDKEVEKKNYALRVAQQAVTYAKFTAEQDQTKRNNMLQDAQTRRDIEEHESRERIKTLQAQKLQEELDATPRTIESMTERNGKLVIKWSDGEETLEKLGANQSKVDPSLFLVKTIQDPYDKQRLKQIWEKRHPDGKVEIVEKSVPKLSPLEGTGAMPASTSKDLRVIERSLKILSIYKGAMDELVGGTENIGPVLGRIMKMKAQFVGDDIAFVDSLTPEEAKIYATANMIKSAIIRAITGAQMSFHEIPYIEGQIPLITDPADVWMAKFDLLVTVFDFEKQLIFKQYGNPYEKGNDDPAGDITEESLEGMTDEELKEFIK